MVDDVFLTIWKKKQMSYANKERILWHHKQIHDGLAFYVKGIHEWTEEEPETWDLIALARYSTITHLIPHVSWEFKSNREVILEIYEGVQITGTPSEVDAFENEANNRMIPIAEHLKYSFYQSGFTIIELGHRMWHSIFGNDYGNETHEGKPELLADPIDENHNYYLFRFNKESNQKGYLDIHISFYLN